MIVSLVGGPHCGHHHTIESGPGAMFKVNGIKMAMSGQGV